VARADDGKVLLIVRHSPEVGTALRLERVEYSLDGEQEYFFSAGDKGTAPRSGGVVIDRELSAGKHKVEAVAVYRRDAAPHFRACLLKAESSYTVEADAGSVVSLQVIWRGKGDAMLCPQVELTSSFDVTATVRTSAAVKQFRAASVTPVGSGARVKKRVGTIDLSDVPRVRLLSDPTDQSLDALRQEIKGLDLEVAASARALEAKAARFREVGESLIIPCLDNRAAALSKLAKGVPALLRGFNKSFKKKKKGMARFIYLQLADVCASAGTILREAESCFGPGN